jgi:hypothetical protein
VRSHPNSLFQIRPELAVPWMNSAPALISPQRGSETPSVPIVTSAMAGLHAQQSE